MALTITATWLPEAYGYRLDAAGSSGAVSWYRTAYWPDGRFSNVTLGIGTQVHDLSVPLDGATVTYTAVDQAGSDEAVASPPTVGRPVLGVIDSAEIPAAQVVVESMREQSVTGRPVFYDVIGRNEPYVEPMTPIERTGSMTLVVAHPGGSFPGDVVAALRRMLRTGGRMMLRSPCGGSGRVEDLTFVVLRWTESHTGGGNLHGPDRRITVDWRAVDPLWGVDVMTGRIWGMVPQEFATWGDVVAAVPTWGELVDG